MTQNPKVTEGVADLIKIVFIILVVAAQVTSVGAEAIMTLPSGGRALADRFVVVVKTGTPVLHVGHAFGGYAISGIFSIDHACFDAKVTRIEQWYPYPVTDERLKALVERMYVFYVGSPADLDRALAILSTDPHIESAEYYGIPEPFLTPNDPYRTSQWFLAKVKAYEGWDLISGDPTRYSIIGIVDTGIYWMHPDLAPNMWVNQAEDLNHNRTLDPGDINGIDDDGNGFVDDVIGWDLGENDNDPRENSPLHGTHVAGCASEATNNGIGGAGMGWSALLMAVKGANASGDLTHVWQGVIWAANNGAHIINCSWGGVGYSSWEQNIINTVYSMGCLVVAAAGNDDYWTPPYVCYPAAYNHVLAVAATNQTDQKASFSNYGTWVDISAPGTGIYSTWGNNSYTSANGTSMASPIVAGAAALLKAIDHSLTPDQITTHLKNAADSIDHLNPGYAGMLGSGRLNVYEALVPLSFIAGDVNGNGTVDGADVTYLVRYLKGLGPAPPDPIWRADANGNCLIQGSDVTFLVQYFKGGSAPVKGNCG